MTKGVFGALSSSLHPGLPSRVPPRPAISPAFKAALDHFQAGRMEVAIDHLRALLRRDPNNDNAKLLLGCALFETRQDEPAAYMLRQAVAANPNDGQRWVHLGRVLERLEGPKSAIDALEGALAGPAGATKAAAQINLVLSHCYEGAQRLEDAIAACRRALTIDPAFGPARSLLGATLFHAGHIDDAIAEMRAGIASNPNDIRRRASYCFYLNYSDRVSPQEVFAAHRELGELARQQMPAPTPLAPRDPAKRPLRVGLVSGDFRQHSVRYFLPAILDHLSPAQFELTLISTTRNRDEQTDILRKKAAKWVDAPQLDFAGFGRSVKAVGADILIDLGGLTDSGRVLAFASRLAPVQATYLGYCNTTGTPNVDVRLVDDITDPAGAEAFATERLVRMPGCFVCYSPDETAPAPKHPAPGGPFTFLSFSNSNKLSPSCVALWSRVLQAVPGSRLRLKSQPFADPAVRANTLARFAACGIDAHRIDLLAKTDSVADHLDLYSTGHVALDTTPYAGTTTTCEALWMGVPLVTLRGSTHASRVGASLLAAAGHPEWTADTPDDFVRIASDLAQAPEHLAALRTSLRAEVAGAPLCDQVSFAAKFAQTLLQIWDHRPA